MPVFSWGANSYGQLGLGHCEDEWTPVVLGKLPFEKISTVAGGGGHTVIIGENGCVAACGNNSKGQLGVELSVKKVTSFTEIHLDCVSSTPSDVSCGWEHTLITTVDGRVYGFGCNGYNQLALDGQMAASSKAVPISDLQDVTKTACGLRHSVALTRDGRVFCWGEGRRGQLGRISVDKRRPACIEDIPEPVVDIAAGQQHSAALTASGSVYVWGCNKYGQLGIDSSKVVSSHLPIRISSLPQDIIAIHSGWSHLIACNSEGHLYSWGRSNYGQLGALPTKFATFGHRFQPLLVENFRCCIFDSMPLFGCGSEHNLALDSSEGVLHSWGWNEHGMCGLGLHTGDIVYEPRSIPGSSDQIMRVACGSGHSFVLTRAE